MELVTSDDIVTFAGRTVDERDRDGAGDWHGPDLPVPHRPDMVVLNANDILGRPADGQGWAEAGGSEGKGTKDAPEKILTVGEFMTLTAAVGAGTGVQAAGELIGLEAIVAAGPTAVMTLVGAGVQRSSRPGYSGSRVAPGSAKGSSGKTGLTRRPTISSMATKITS